MFIRAFIWTSADILIMTNYTKIPSDNDKHNNLFHPYHVNAIRDDEISLVEQWILLSRYKKQFTFTFLLVFMFVFIYLFFIYEEKYSLVSTIQVGTIEKDNTILPIESPDSLLSKVKNSMIPSYTYAWVKDHDYHGVIETSSSNPKNTNILLISNQVNDDNVEIISDFQKGLLSIIKDDHKRIFNALKSGVLSQLNLAQLELNKLRNPLELEQKLKKIQIKLDEEEIKLKKLEDERYFGVQKAEFQNDILQEEHKLKRLNDTEELFIKQLERIENNKRILFDSINNLSDQIEEAVSLKQTAVIDATELSAMSQLLIDNEIRQSQNRLLSLEERYYVTLENDKFDLLNQIEHIQLQKVELKENIDLLKEKFNRLLIDNKFMRAQQRLAVEEVKIELEQTKFHHQTSITEQEEKLSEINARLDNINETRIVSLAIPSLKASGLARNKLLILSLFFAVAAGFIAMLLALFRDKVKKKLSEVSS